MTEEAKPNSVVPSDDTGASRPASASVNSVRWRTVGKVIVGVVLLVSGIYFSRLREPPVEVDALMINGNVPALRFAVAGTKGRPVAVLTHGVTGCKETLYRLAEALAAAGFDCYAMDLPGHGASPLPFGMKRMARVLGDACRTIGPVDVFVGHSMGSYVGSGSVREGSLNPKLFISVGALPRFGTNHPPLLLLAGTIEEAVPVALLKSATDARLMLFPGCDHALEPFDPRLVRAAVEAACASAELPVPQSTPVQWVGRLAGWCMAMLAAVILALALPPLRPRIAWTRGPLIALWFITVMALTFMTWFNMSPHLRRLPQQVGMIGVGWLALWLARLLKVPQWTFTIGTLTVGVACAAVGLQFVALVLVIVAAIFAGGRIAGCVAAHNGTAQDADLAAATVAGYTLGQLLPVLY